MDKSFNIALLRGDGIGPEVVNEAVKVLDAISKRYSIDFNYRDALMGASAIDATGEALPEETLAICLESDAILLGAIGDPRFDNNPDSPVRPEQGLLALRKKLGLFCNVRPIKVYDSLKQLSPLKEHIVSGVDFVIFRELTGGIYFGDKEKSENFASDLCKYYDYEIERICREAFKAAKHRRKKVCLVDKANVLESSRLWRKVFQRLSKEYPEIETDFMFVDNAAMQLILRPSQFDVIVTSNMFGDILSDAGSVLSGSLGLLPSSSVGTEGSLYEPVHGSYPQAAGLNIANPMATILSVEMMLRDLKLFTEAEAISTSISECLKHKILTQELNSENAYSCSDIGDFIANQINYGTSTALNIINKTLKESSVN